MDQEQELCIQCPRKCRVNRNAEETGVCGETSRIRLARAALHMWEEPSISGKNGSGAIFFSGCTMRCVYCQNYHISIGDCGKEITSERLIQIMLELQEQGANNINLVTPTHFSDQIAKALQKVKGRNLQIPVVYNTSGYETVESLMQLEGLVDIYLPDFKYINADHARKYSKAPDYPEVVKLAIQEMVRQCPRCEFDEQGRMKSGVIVRHLLLPGCLMDAKKIVRYLHETYQDQIYMSLMNQYTPLETLDIEKYPELSGKVSKKSYEKLIDYALKIGVENAYIQEGNTALESFIPAFDYEGVLQKGEENGGTRNSDIV